MYQPLGAINSGDTIILCKVLNGISYVAIGSSQFNVIFVPILSSNVSNAVIYNEIINNGNILRFTVTGNQNQLILTSNNTNGSLAPSTSTASNPLLIFNNSTSLTVTSQFQLPPSPSILLSGVEYTITFNGRPTSFYIELPLSNGVPRSNFWNIHTYIY